MHEAGPSTAADTQTAPPLSRPVILAVLAASAAVAGFAISNQSFWIDEALSLVVAMAPNPSEAWLYAQAVSGSTLQMPLYQVYLFLWHKVFGGGEWAMRAANIPWILLAQLAFLVLLRHKPKLALTACLLAAVSPILWSYLDETRPYIMQYAAACWLVAAIVRFSSPLHPPLATRHTSLLLLALALATIVLIGSSLLGVIWSGGFALAFLYLWKASPADRPRPALLSRSVLLVALPAALLIAALGTYYLLTWDLAGSGHHRIGAQIFTVPYILYEMLGFAGFGPGKLQMRLEPVRSLARHLPGGKIAPGGPPGKPPETGNGCREKRSGQPGR